MNKRTYDTVKIGDTFERWTVIGERFPQTRSIDGSDEWFVPCRCVCGYARAVRIAQLLNGHSMSCGCKKGESNVLHGEAGRARTHLYRVWYAMKARCSNPRNQGYALYGGRGISVCDEWNAFIIFRDWATSHGYSPDLELDRINTNGNYSPDNCRWVTPQANKRNTRANHFVTAFGETKCIADWILDSRCAMSFGGLTDRIRKGWSPEKAITTPPLTRQERGQNFHKVNSRQG